MTLDFATSNLSKIKPKFRTSGNISQPRRKAGSSLNELGQTSKEQVKCVKPDEYISRLHSAFESATDPKLKQFIYQELRKIYIQRGMW
jgi:hypothetical protein